MLNEASGQALPDRSPTSASQGTDNVLEEERLKTKFQVERRK